MNIVKPGTEDIVLSTSIIDLMICTDDHLGKNKVRHCFIHKRRQDLVHSQYTNAAGKPVSVVTTQVFEDVQTLLLNTMRRIQDLERDIDKYKTQCEAYKITIDTLRKNGVID